MNQWHLGYIKDTLVYIFLSDDYQMDYLVETERYPKSVEAACERIRASRPRSVNGCQKVLAENGWHNDKLPHVL